MFFRRSNSKRTVNPLLDGELILMVSISLSALAALLLGVALIYLSSTTHTLNRKLNNFVQKCSNPLGNGSSPVQSSD